MFQMQAWWWTRRQFGYKHEQVGNRSEVRPHLLLRLAVTSLFLPHLTLQASTPPPVTPLLSLTYAGCLSPGLAGLAGRGVIVLCGFGRTTQMNLQDAGSSIITICHLNHRTRHHGGCTGGHICVCVCYHNNLRRENRILQGGNMFSAHRSFKASIQDFRFREF